MMRTSTLRVSVSPTRLNVPSCSTRSTLTCSAGDMSPISSRKNVPRSAISNRPGLSATAPVNAPRLWPNSSESSRLSLNARAVRDDEALVARAAELSWIARATSSLPVPFSPWTSTVESDVDDLVEQAIQLLHRAAAADDVVVDNGGELPLLLAAPLAAAGLGGIADHLLGAELGQLGQELVVTGGRMQHQLPPLIPHQRIPDPRCDSALNAIPVAVFSRFHTTSFSPETKLCPARVDNRGVIYFGLQGGIQSPTVKSGIIDIGCYQRK